MKPQDPQAESITFGVELETTIPATSGIVVGGYHFGAAVTVGAANGTTQHLTAPTFKRTCLVKEWPRHDSSVFQEARSWDP